MPRPVPRRRVVVPATPPPTKQSPTGHQINSFLHHLGSIGSVSYAASRAGLDRRALYRRREEDAEFAARWEEALNLGVERLQDNAMNRALKGTPRPVWRNGKQIGAVRQFDNGLLRFLLRAHRPETYGDGSKASASPLPFDLAQRLAAAAPRLEAHLAERRALEVAERKTQGEEPKNGKGRK